jgi:hypothetical protein
MTSNVSLKSPHTTKLDFGKLNSGLVEKIALVAMMKEMGMANAAMSKGDMRGACKMRAEKNGFEERLKVLMAQYPPVHAGGFFMRSSGPACRRDAVRSPLIVNWWTRNGDYPMTPATRCLPGRPRSTVRRTDRLPNQPAFRAPDCWHRGSR